MQVRKLCVIAVDRRRLR